MTTIAVVIAGRAITIGREIYKRSIHQCTKPKQKIRKEINSGNTGTNRKNTNMIVHHAKNI